ncbi:MAG TPA: isocitrate/isopropylmalate family dehydrogenase [Myxococcota bacterium]|nr:isocitrate/isopropylmalate family dehydrogenase [Myxococcota bacterium]
MEAKITIRAGKLDVPGQPIIPYIEGDGVGPEVIGAMRRVVDAAVLSAYQSQRMIAWKELEAGGKAFNNHGEHLPEKTLDDLREHVVAIKGPLTTPVGGGFRSLNVTIRRELELYSCIRPLRFYGAASPLAHPERLDLVVFRENSEDVYVGAELASGSPEAGKLITLLRDFGFGDDLVAEDSAVGIKPLSPGRTRRHVRRALRWALANRRRRVTFVHKGNIMKLTEGAFLRWGYDVCSEEEFKDRIAVDDCLADHMLFEILTRADEYDLLVAPNLNGDFISDAAAAVAGGPGMAPGANIGDTAAVFEANHGSAVRHAGRDDINPSACILSGAMLLDHIGWIEAAAAIRGAVSRTLAERRGTYDLARAWRQAGERNVEELSCSALAVAYIDNLRNAGEDR